MEDDNVKTLEKRDYTDETGKFAEGNPGRPKGSKNYLTLLEEAIKKYETETGKKLFERLIQRAFINDTVLLNVIKKFVPDKTQTEITTPEPIKAEFVVVDDKNAADKSN